MEIDETIPGACERCGRPRSDPTLAITTASGRRLCGPACFARALQDGTMTLATRAKSVDPGRSPISSDVVSSYTSGGPWLPVSLIGGKVSFGGEPIGVISAETIYETAPGSGPVIRDITVEPLRSAAVDAKREAWVSGLTPIDVLDEFMRANATTHRAPHGVAPIMRAEPETELSDGLAERCGCGHHDIDPACDRYAQHREWCYSNAKRDPAERANPREWDVTALRDGWAFPGVGISAPGPEPLTVDDATGDDVARDMSPSEIRAWRERQR